MLTPHRQTMRLRDYGLVEIAIADLATGTLTRGSLGDIGRYSAEAFRKRPFRAADSRETYQDVDGDKRGMRPTEFSSNPDVRFRCADCE